jgi:predicted Rossmann fold flavoprotein
MSYQIIRTLKQPKKPIPIYIPATINLLLSLMTSKEKDNNLLRLSSTSKRIAGGKLIVIGGGAAGFFCAINAARLNPGLSVVILEKTNKLLSKVRISGGGRCNVTHACFDIAEMSKRYPRGKNFVKKSFHRFFTTDTIEWFRERGVELKTEKDGRMFPVNDESSTIISCLLNEANRYGVQVSMNHEVQQIETSNDIFRCVLVSGKIETANYLCIATGGYPKDSMFNWLKSIGHTIAQPVPSLFTFNLQQHSITQLMGITNDNVRLKVEGTKLMEQGPVLVTHWGLSGPAVLRLSAWGARELAALNYNFKVHINWIPGITNEKLQADLKSLRSTQSGKKISNFNFTLLPNRLWQFLLEEAGVIAETRFADLTSKAENALARNLLDYIVEVKGKTTFKEEFVTAGGINLFEIDANTMMSKKVKNLFFAGEVMDVDGITGGFNFQHAWTSGWIAAKAIAANG